MSKTKLSPTLAVEIANLEALIAEKKAIHNAAQAKQDEANKAKVESLPVMFGLAKGDYAGVITTIRRITGTHGKRVSITDEIRKQVIEMAKNKQTGASIAQAVGISLPSVAKIKADAGLTTKRKTAAAGK